jgi:hypothetical protein
MPAITKDSFHQADLLSLRRRVEGRFLREEQRGLFLVEALS